jgi:predicted RNase H-like nuclease
MSVPAPWLAGVDGCRSGWVAAFVRPAADEGRICVFEHFAEILSALESPAIVAVDVPIGLLDHSYGGRKADNLVRQLLTKRRSSVFPVPSRKAIFAAPGPYADSQSRRHAYQRTCSVAASTSTPPRRISIFTFGILEKIREVDIVLRGNSAAARRVFETHPEFVFQGLNRGEAIAEPKTNDTGLRLRRKLLVKAGLPAAIVNGPTPRGAKPDDLLDALACAATARKLHAGTALPFPDPPGRDTFGLPVAIWA